MHRDRLTCLRTQEDHRHQVRSIVRPLLFTAHTNDLPLGINYLQEATIFDDTSAIISCKNFDNFRTVSDLFLSYMSKVYAAKLAQNLDKTSAIKHIWNNLPQCAASTGYKEKYVGQMVHTKFQGLQTDSQLNWRNHINQTSKCACNARAHLLM